MRREFRLGTRIVSLTLALLLCGVPQFVAAQQQPPAPPAAKPGAAQDSQNLPNAPSTQSAQVKQQDSQQKKQPQAPAGAAAAEASPTAGGAGSRPAGMAIAPAKQHQVRSFLIKLGAIAGGAVALGTIYALSRSSPSRPPGAK